MSLSRSALALFATTVLGAQPASLVLPAPAAGGATLSAALQGRKTVRALGGPGLTLTEAGQMFWAAQGENRPGHRTVPSAKAKYPLRMYLLTAGSDSLPAGEYLYQPAGNKLVGVADGSPKATLGSVQGMQPWIAAAPAVFVVAGVPTRFDPTGQGQALNFTYYEGGAAAQCLLLQAVALGLDAGTAAGLNMKLVAAALGLPNDTQILTVLPVGRQ